MQYLNIFVLTIIAFYGYSQDVVLFHKDGSVVKTKVKATSDTQLFTQNGNYNYDVIDSVFSEDKALLEKLKGKIGGFKTTMSTGTIHTKKIVVNGVDINQLDIEFIEIIGFQILPPKVQVVVYYGQPIKGFEDQTIKDDLGKSIRFNGVIDALNFMYKNGWEYRDSFAVNTGTGGSVYHYILRKVH
ncbi:MAG TPA: hypothetical protein VK589_11855 [Chryseolinea sp.]|nr:hypothetical protein [Chryseolinea sp.]